MTKLNFTSTRLRLAALTVAAAGVMLAGNAVQAQSYDSYDDGPNYADTAYTSTDNADTAYTVDELTVTAPEVVGRSSIGAPIEAVRASRVVEFRDLDLDTAWGARELRARIRYAARSACDELDARYPITVDNPGDCYRDAVRTGMRRASYVTGYQFADY